jgi:shikimate kinase
MKIKSPKFKVFVFYGPFAVGKYTVAKEFHKQTGFKFFHNHHTYNLGRELFQRDTIELHRIIERLRLTVFEEIAKGKLNTVTTHAYSNNYVSLTGLTDKAFVKKVESIIEKAGGKIYFVKLKTSNKVLLQRVSSRSRKKLNKLTDINTMKRIIKQKFDWNTLAPVKNNIEIDNTNLSPKQVVKNILGMNLI